MSRLLRARRARVARTALARSEEAEDAERRAARQRLLDAARHRHNAGPTWNSATTALPTTNQRFMTRGQLHRGRGA